jgi:transcriptional regulator with XRE-family HTH domain
MTTSRPRPELQESAARIAMALETQGLTHDQAAEALERSPLSVRNWAEGKTVPSPGVQPRLAELLHLHVRDLVPPGWVDHRSGPMSAEERRARKLERDRRYRQRAQQTPGPATQAVSLAESMGHVPVPGPPRGRTQEADTLLATTIRADGLMTIKLNLTLPVTQGIALVQMLYAADALKTLPAPTAEGDALSEPSS